MHRLADDRVRGLDVTRQDAGHHLAGVHAHPDGEPCALLPSELRVQLADRVAYRERRMERARRVVLVRHGGAEDGHHRVADVLVERAVVARDLTGDRAEERAEQLPQLLGVQPSGNDGRADEVREEHRDLTALFGELAVTCRDLQ